MRERALATESAAVEPAGVGGDAAFTVISSYRIGRIVLNLSSFSQRKQAFLGTIFFVCTHQHFQMVGFSRAQTKIFGEQEKQQGTHETCESQGP